MTFTHQINEAGTGTLFTFENGVTLNAQAKDGTGTVEYPPRGDVGSFGFPIRHSGDCFHALKQGLPIPPQCKAW